MRVRLIRKFAERLDGIDLSRCAVGDELNLSLRKARLLVAERWGIFLAERRHNVATARHRERRHERQE